MYKHAQSPMTRNLSFKIIPLRKLWSKKMWQLHQKYGLINNKENSPKSMKVPWLTHTTKPQINRGVQCFTLKNPGMCWWTSFMSENRKPIPDYLRFVCKTKMKKKPNIKIKKKKNEKNREKSIPKSPQTIMKLDIEDYWKSDKRFTDTVLLISTASMMIKH